MRKLQTIILLLLLASCATQAGYQKILDSWKGSDVDSIVRSWGTPQGYYKNKDGSGQIEYTDSRSSTYTTDDKQYNYDTGEYELKGVNVHTLNFNCKTTFKFNSSNKIYTWSYQGNNCIAKDPDTNVGQSLKQSIGNLFQKGCSVERAKKGECRYSP